MVKGQVKIQQMAFMIIGLTILFVIVGLFFVSFYLSGLKNTKANLDEEEAFLLVTRLADYPELSCEESFGPGLSKCVDFDKLMVLKEKNETYSEFFGISGLELIRIYPKANGECTRDNYPNCERLVVIEDKNLGVDKSNFVTLCRKEKLQNGFYDKCELAKLVVRYQ